MKTLYQRIVEQLKKEGMTFNLSKETYTKYVGVLIDDKTKLELPHEIEKSVQIHLVNQYVKSIRNLMDMHIKIQEMRKNTEENKKWKTMKK